MSEVMTRKFWHCSKSPKGAFVLKAFDNADDCIVIGSYDDEGGCDYEFNVLWRGGAAELLIYGDCWPAIADFKDLFDLMAGADEAITPTEFCDLLSSLGISESGEDDV